MSYRNISQRWESHKRIQKEAGGVIPDIWKVTKSHPYHRTSEEDSAKIPHGASERVSFIQLSRWGSWKWFTDRGYPLTWPLLLPSTLNMIKGSIEASCGGPGTTLRQAGQTSSQVWCFYFCKDIGIPITKLWRHMQMKMIWKAYL